MDWLVGLLLLVAGGIIGFFVAKYIGNNQPEASGPSASELTEKELINQQSLAHVQQSKQLIDSLVTQSNQLKIQMEKYEETLSHQQFTHNESGLNYFGEHASAYLRNKSKSPSREKKQADIQPLDFSSKSSGLFTGSDVTSLNETKQ